MVAITEAMIRKELTNLIIRKTLNPDCNLPSIEEATCYLIDVSY